MGWQATSGDTVLDKMIFKVIIPLVLGDPKVQDPWPTEHNCVPSLDLCEKMLEVLAGFSGGWCWHLLTKGNHPAVYLKNHKLKNAQTIWAKVAKKVSSSFQLGRKRYSH